jgi:hypothetical protein
MHCVVWIEPASLQKSDISNILAQTSPLNLPQSSKFDDDDDAVVAPHAITAKIKALKWGARLSTRLVYEQYHNTHAINNHQTCALTALAISAVEAGRKLEPTNLRAESEYSTLRE